MAWHRFVSSYAVDVTDYETTRTFFVDFSTKPNSSPAPAKSLAMPAYHGFGTNDDKRILPARPVSGEHDPEGSIQR